MYRDKGSQVIFIYARDIVSDIPKTGDAGNITVNITGDGGSLSASSNSVSELDATNAPGIYPLVLTKNETDADCIVFTGLSTTPDIEIQPVIVQTNNQNVSTIDGNSTAANNLKLQYNGTGLTGDEFPSTQVAVASISTASGGALNFETIEDNTGGTIDPSEVAFVGSVQSGTYENTSTQDGVVHEIDDVGNDIDIVYGFSIGATETAVNVSIYVNLSGDNDELRVKAYDHIGDTWNTVGTLEGSGGDMFKALGLSLLSKHSAGTGSEDGKVYIRLERESTSPNTLEVDKILISAVSTMRGTDGANTTVPDAAGTAAGLHSTTDSKIDAVKVDTAAILVDTDFLQKMAEGDMTVDTTTTPWQLVIKEKGTANELIRKDIKTPAGVDITSAASIIGQTVEP